MFPLISGTRQRYLLLILLFSVVLEVLTTEIREGNEVKGIQIGKEVKLSLFAYNMYIYIEDLKDATRKLLELINEFGKVTGYKINTEKSVAFPGYDKQKSTTIKKKKSVAFQYTYNERSEREIQEAIPFTIASERTKYLGINLPQETKDLYSKNYKMLMKETKKT